MAEFEYMSKIITRRGRYRWQRPKLLLDLIWSDRWLIRQGLELLKERKSATVDRCHESLTKGRTNHPDFTQKTMAQAELDIDRIDAIWELFDDLDKKEAALDDKSDREDKEILKKRGK